MAKRRAAMAGKSIRILADAQNPMPTDTVDATTAFAMD
jgi:hypothetical protein